MVELDLLVFFAALLRRVVLDVFGMAFSVLGHAVMFLLHGAAFRREFITLREHGA
jgi:hypothetical protein